MPASNVNEGVDLKGRIEMMQWEKKWLTLALTCSNVVHYLELLQQLKKKKKGRQFSVPQIEYPLEGSSKKCSHLFFLLIVAMVLLL